MMYMEQQNVYVVGQLLAAYVEVEAMKQANKEDERTNQVFTYNSQDFFNKADQIRNITQQLFL